MNLCNYTEEVYVHYKAYAMLQSSVKSASQSESFQKIPHKRWCVYTLLPPSEHNIMSQTEVYRQLPAYPTGNLVSIHILQGTKWIYIPRESSVIQASYVNPLIKIMGSILQLGRNSVRATVLYINMHAVLHHPLLCGSIYKHNYGSEKLMHHAYTCSDSTPTHK